MRSLRMVLLVTGTAVLSLLACRPVSAQNDDERMQTSSSVPGPDENAWHVALSPYLWFAGAHGTVGAFDHNLSVHASPGDLLSHFDIGAMATAEARHQRLLLDGDMLWIRLSDSRAIPFPGQNVVTASASVGQFVWTSKAGYRVIDEENIKGDATVGVRYWHLGQKLNFNPSTLGLSSQGTRDWADIVVGGKIRIPLGEKIVVDALGDVGGWGLGAQLDYQFAALFGCKVSPRWTVVAGYRYLSVDYRPSHSVFNTVTSGAVFGATYTLKQQN